MLGLDSSKKNGTLLVLKFCLMAKKYLMEKNM